MPLLLLISVVPMTALCVLAGEVAAAHCAALGYLCHGTPLPTDLLCLACTFQRGSTGRSRTGRAYAIPVLLQRDALLRIRHCRCRSSLGHPKVMLCTQYVLDMRPLAGMGLNIAPWSSVPNSAGIDILQFIVLQPTYFKVLIWKLVACNL